MFAAHRISYFFIDAEYEEIFFISYYTSITLLKIKKQFLPLKFIYKICLIISYLVCLKYLTRVHTCKDLSVAWDWLLIRRFLTLYFKRIEDVVRCVTVALLICRRRCRLFVLFILALCFLCVVRALAEV